MPRFGTSRVRMVSIRTSPSEDRRLVQIRVCDGDDDGEILGALSPNLLRGMGIPIDVGDPDSWNAEVQVSDGFLKKVANLNK